MHLILVLVRVAARLCEGYFLFSTLFSNNSYQIKNIARTIYSYLKKNKKSNKHFRAGISRSSSREWYRKKAAPSRVRTGKLCRFAPLTVPHFSGVAGVTMTVNGKML